MKFVSSRDSNLSYTFAEAVRRALAEDGGLIVPESVPSVEGTLYQTAPYPELVCAVLEAFVPELDKARLKQEVADNYRDFPIPLIKTGSGSFLELFHGPTGAFKDVALTMLPRIDRLTGQGEKIYVTATSGDTGKAALEAFRDQPGSKLMVFYPEEGVSHLQKLQMQTQAGSNLTAVAIKGDFDDAQRGVKAILQEFSGKGVSSCNSINIARLLTQIPYYWHSAAQAGRDGLSYIVPSGNFGDILAGWYARSMGLKMGRLIAATNDNKVLADFIQTGTYDRQRTLKKTSSPSMDILVSSNVERLLFHLFGAKRTAAWMQELKEQGSYEADPEAFDGFGAGSATEAQVRAAIRLVYESEGYLMDPHTACAWVVWDKLGRPKDHVILATASPFKFPAVIREALTGEKSTEQEALDYLSGLTTPHPAIRGIFDRPLLHTRSIAPDRMREEFLTFAGGLR